MILRAGLLVLALLWAPGATTADPGRGAVFDPGKSCVAYRTSKTVLFGFHIEIVGRSCELAVWLEPSEDADGSVLFVSVPIESFASGNFLRDNAVADLLRQADQADLEFRSQPFHAPSVRAGLQTGSLSISGELRIGGTDYPVRFDVTLPAAGGVMATGLHRGSFAEFGVEVPPVAGGLIVKPGEKLDLLVQLDVRTIIGLKEWAEAHELAALDADDGNQ